MQPPIGFVLLTHNKPHQVMRLINKLNQMFDAPPIVCHHDFSKSQLPDELSSNVTLVRPHLQTGWGEFPLVDAVLRALELMYQAPTAPDWVVLLSGVDYPIKSAEQILSDLASSPYDVHISHAEIDHTKCHDGGLNKEYHNIGGPLGSHWQELCYERYCVLRPWLPFLSWKFLLRGEFRFYRRELFILRNSLITRLFLPFSKDFRCFAGGQWFSANRKAVEYLLKFHQTKPALATHYRWQDLTGTIVPDESYCHTIFCNAPELNVSPNSWRYVDWSKPGAHPKTLLMEDLEKLHVSSAHFGRKFDIDMDAKVLDEIDAMIG